MGNRGKDLLTATRAKAFTASDAAGPRSLSDGAGLELEVTKEGYSRWCFRYSYGGKQRRLMLGSANPSSAKSLTLLEARTARNKAAETLKTGIDPAHVNSASAKREAEKRKAGIPTFGDFAAKFLEKLKLPKKAKQPWQLSLMTYAAPLHRKPMNAITVQHVAQALEPIWHTTPETARRTRSRIEAVFRAAIPEGFRHTDTMGQPILQPNPAMWKGVLDSQPELQQRDRRSKKKTKHHAAMPFAQVPAFVDRLKSMEGNSARALHFAILTAARTGEVIGCKWSEIDFENRLWTVPAERMKAGDEHVVPLTQAAIELLKSIPRLTSSPYVFQGAKAGKPLSNMSLLMQLRRMKCDYTPHGFRSSFRVWVSERTSFTREIAEMALAHKVGSDVERAYNRTTLLERRRALADAWAAFCEPQGAGNVLTFKVSAT